MNYKLNEEITSVTVTQTALGRALGISQQRIGQLIDEGIVIRDDFDRGGRVMLFESLKNHFLSKNAVLGAGASSVNFWKERGLHEKAKRELAELKLLKSRGAVYDADTVEGVLIELLTNFRNKLLGLPSKYAPQLEGKNREEIYTLLTAAIEEELTELSEGVQAVDFDEDGEPAEEKTADSGKADKKAKRVGMGG